MNDCIYSSDNAAVFSTLDCKSGYWQVPVVEKDKENTSFTSHMGKFRFNGMPFGFKNTPATFQSALRINLSGVGWQICLLYLDEFIVMVKDSQSHIRQLDEVLALPNKASLSLKLKKCEFFNNL